MWKRYRRSLYWLLLFGSLLLGKLVQDTEGFLDLRAQTLRRIEQAQELGIVHLQQHTGDFPSKVRLRSITRCVKGWIRQRTRRHLRGNAHVKDFTEHLFLFHRWGTRKRCRIERRQVRGMANGWGGSGSATISLLGTFGVLGSVAWRRSTTALRLAGLRTGLPSTNSGLTRTTILGRTRSATVVRGVPITLRRLAVGARWNHCRYLSGRVTGTGRDHAWLTITHHATSTGGREVTTRGVVHRTVHVATRDAGSSSLLHANLVALSDLALQLLPADLTALGQRDIEWLGTNHLVVHLCDGLRGFLGAGVANETKTLGMVLIIAHDFGTGNSSERLELPTKFFVIDVVVKILDIEVDALVLAQLLHLGLLVRLLQFFLAFCLLLRSGDVNLLAIVLAIVEALDSIGSIDVALKVDESKASASSLGIYLKDSRGDRSELSEHIPEFFLRDLSIQVLDVDVGELFLLLVNFGHAFLINKPRKGL